ncbi:sterol 3-beta-glucosyltransferase UGT80B1-like isoform X1 [Salvia splendens]|uniref:sterol 3-beta-glucosyltransferase UGT80B1-like isoform X1 n=1 Tax=Salvia splendens TaxID=180675 RepID=UPI001C25ED9D|nr:sterol 3-beta-glucosyltransferase UGT80B1-like isoform X1 [Salvia splendens]
MPFMLQPEVKSRAAADVAVSVRDDDGAAAALDSFHRHLPLAKPEQGHHESGADPILVGAHAGQVLPEARHHVIEEDGVLRKRPQ